MNNPARQIRDCLNDSPEKSLKLRKWLEDKSGQSVQLHAPARSVSYRFSHGEITISSSSLSVTGDTGINREDVLEYLQAEFPECFDGVL